MLVESVSVRNFKLFGDFAVEGLRRFTLLGGDNNCGKTTLLEAVFMCFHWGWDSAKEHPILTPVFRPLRDASIFDQSAFNRLFHKGDLDSPLDISCVEGGVAYAVKVARPREEPMLGSIAVPFSKMAKPANGMQFKVTPLNRMLAEHFIVENGERKEKAKVLVTLGDQGLDFKRLMPDQPVDKLVFISMNGGMVGEGAEDTDVLGQLIISGKEGAVVEALRIIAPKASGIATPSVRNQTKIFVKVGDAESMVPAALLGIGAQKLVSLAVHLNRHQNCLFLLDEVTVGWHHSHLTDLWRMIFRICKERDHQVVATTHSREGIAAFAQAAQDEEAQDDSCYIRLGPAHEGDSPGKINPVYYTYERLHAALEMGVKVL